MSQTHPHDWWGTIGGSPRSGPGARGSSRQYLRRRAEEGGTRGLAWCPDGSRLASAGGDRLVRVWNPETGLVALTIHASRFPVEKLAWSPDGRRLVSTDTPWTLKVWDGGEQAGPSPRR